MGGNPQKIYIYLYISAKNMKNFEKTLFDKCQQMLANVN